MGLVEDQIAREDRIVVGQGDDHLGVCLGVEEFLGEIVDPVDGERTIEDLDVSVSRIDQLGHCQSGGHRRIGEGGVQPSDMVRVIVGHHYLDDRLVERVDGSPAAFRVTVSIPGVDDDERRRRLDDVGPGVEARAQVGVDREIADRVRRHRSPWVGGFELG